MPLVSVLLAVHNDARFIHAAVQSMLRQTLRDFELIVIDDASTDETPAILEAVTDPRFVGVRSDEQLGLARSLNRGFDRATGRYVARLDADDIALPTRLAAQVARMKDGALAVLGTAVFDIDERGAVGTLHRNPADAYAVRWLSLFSSPFFHPTVLVDRERLDRRGLRYDPAYLESEDYDLWTRLLEDETGANLLEPLVLKRVHARQASLRRSELQQSFQREIALRTIAQVAPQLSADDAERAWAFGTGTDGSRQAYLSLLDAFEQRFGTRHTVREAAARRLLRAHAWRDAACLGAAAPTRAVLGGVARRSRERTERERAASWLASLDTTRRRVRVAFVSPEPTPYRAPLLDRVAFHPEIDLTVIYAARTVAGRTWSVEVHHRAVYLAGTRVPGLRHVLRHDYPITPGIGRALAATQADVIVVSGWSTFAAQAAVAWARRHGVPLALLVESHDLGPRARWRRVVKRTIVPALVRSARTFLVVGSLARDSLISLGASADRVRVFANTIDVAAWEARAERLVAKRDDLRAALDLGSEDVAVLSVGRLAPEKGLDMLVRAVAAAGDSRFAVVVAGAGPDRGPLERLAADLGVRVRLLGNLAEDELAEVYVAADVFALFSRHETWGVVVNEAMASGLPVVLSDRVGAAHDLVREGDNGWVVGAEDVGGAADALGRLANDAELRRRMGSRSRELVRGWSYDASVDNFVAAVREATSR